jgi:hypothetical protein
MKNKVHLLITTDQEPNIGVLETIKMQIHNVSLVDEAEVVSKLKTALADHFDCDIDNIKVSDLDVKSNTPLNICVQCVIPDVTDCDDEIVVSLTQTYIY